MKVSINIKDIKGPYGGGAIYASDVRDYLVSKGIEVVNTLEDNNIDVILHVNPFPFLMQSSSYSFIEAYIYKLKHSKAIIIQGIHECDERKGTHYMNKLLVSACGYADYIVYVASWLEPLLKKNGLDKKKPSQVILHGSSPEVFNTRGKIFWNKKRPLKIVTHHWGGNYLKGHDFYQRLDVLLDKKEFRDKFQFTFIGNYPKDLEYRNTKLVKPISGHELGEELKKHDVYITASRNEPAGLHHIEGALCGMPLLYIDSGAIKEYCEGYGLEFNKDNFESQLQEMHNNFDKYLEMVKKYDRTADKMGRKHFELISDLYKKRDSYAINSKLNILKIIYYKIYNWAYDKYWRVIRRLRLLK